MPVSKSKRRRYTQPPKTKPKPSPPWVPIVMLGLLVLGVVDLVLYYLGVLPGGPKTLYLLVGFGLIASGFGVGVFWR